MIAVRRLSGVGAFLSLAALLTCNLWGEPGKAKDRKKGKLEAGKAKLINKVDEQLGKEDAPRFVEPMHLYREGKDAEGYFALQVKPKLADAPGQPRDILVLIDTTASKAGGHLEVAKKIAQDLRLKLKSEDRIALWTSNIKTTDVSRGFKAPKDLDEAYKTLEKEVPLGGANLKAALTKAADGFDGKSGRQRVLLFLGDGRSILGAIDEDDRSTLCEKMVKERIGFFTVPLGDQLDPVNLHSFVSGTGGKCVRLGLNDTVGPMLNRLLAAIAEPIFYPTKFKLPAGVTSAFPSKLPPLRRDAPTLVVGRLKNIDQFTYQLVGAVAGKEIRLEVAEKVPAANPENYFLVGIANQWRTRKDRPALLQADRALDHAFSQNQMAREDLLAKGEMAIEHNKLEPALRMFQQALELDPLDGRAKAGVNLVEKMKSGKKTRKELLAEMKLNGDRKVMRIEKGKKGKILVLADGDERQEPEPEQPDPLEDVKKRRAIADQQAAAMVSEVIRQANRQVRVSPVEATELLKRTREGIQGNSDLSPAVAEALISRLSRSLQAVDREGRAIQRNLDEALALRAAADARLDIRRNEAIAQNRIRERMRVFHNLMDQARELEASEQAQAIRADLINEGRRVPTAVQAAYQIGQSAYHLRELRELVRIREDRWLKVLLEVERSAIPFPDEPPIEFPSAAIIRKITRGRYDNWRDFSKDRIAKYSISSFGADMPGRGFELRDLLNKSFNWDPIEVDPAITLDLVLEQLSKKTNITFDIDDRAFKLDQTNEVEKTPIVDKAPIPGGNYTLGTRLKKILARVPSGEGATYLIRRDVIEITTVKFQLQDKALRVYPVADLVVPIPQSINTNALQGAATIFGTTGFQIGGFQLGGQLGFQLGGIQLGGIQLGGIQLGGIQLGGIQLGGIQLGGQIGIQIGGQIGLQVGGQIGLQVGGQLGFQIGGQAGFQNGAQIGGQVGTNFGGQFGNLGGQFGLQGGTQQAILITLIKQVVGRPKDWAITVNPITGEPINPLDDNAVDSGLDRQDNQLGYLPTALALVVKGTSRIHSRASNVVLSVPGGGAGGKELGAAPDMRGRDPLVGGKKPGGRNVAGDGDEQKDKDPKKIWQDALAKGVTEPGMIIATADFLAINNKFDHCAEFLKANLKQGIVVKPWVYKALAIALRESGGSAEEIERADVSAADLEPMGPTGYLTAAKSLAQDGHYDRAIAFCKQAALLEPDVPHAYADAADYAELAKDPKAVEWAAGNLLRQDWPIDNKILQTKATQKLDTLVNLLAKEDRKAEGERLKKAVEGRRRRDLVIQLLWQGEADLDLKVTEPTGSTCSALHKQTVGGGALLGDSLAEPNRETYVAAEGFKGNYTVTVEKIWGRPLGNKAQLKIIRNQGTPDETEELVTLRLTSNTTPPIVVKLADGRRKETAYVPPPSAHKPVERPALVLSATDRVLNTLRDLADPEITGVERGMSGGVGSLGQAATTPRKIWSKDVKASPDDRTVFQNKVRSVVANTLEVTAQTVLSADRRSVRLSLSPVYNTYDTAPAGPVKLNNPVFPGSGR
jgi:hypothetical protein